MVDPDLYLMAGKLNSHGEGYIFQEALVKGLLDHINGNVKV